MIEAFDLGAVGRSASRFDYARLENMNGHFMRATDDAALYETFLKTLPYLPGGPEMAALLDDEGKRAQFRAAFPGLRERAKTLVELVDGAQYLFAQRPLAMDAKAEDILARGGRLHLKVLLPELTRFRSGARRRRRRWCALMASGSAPSSARSRSRCARR